MPQNGFVAFFMKFYYNIFEREATFYFTLCESIKIYALTSFPFRKNSFAFIKSSFSYCYKLHVLETGITGACIYLIASIDETRTLELVRDAWNKHKHVHEIPRCPKQNVFEYTCKSRNNKHMLRAVSSALIKSQLMHTM